MNAIILNCILLSYFRIRCFCYYVFVYFLCFNFPLFPPLGESIILKLELSTRSSLSILEFHIILFYHAFYYYFYHYIRVIVMLMFNRLYTLRHCWGKCKLVLHSKNNLITYQVLLKSLCFLAK